MIALSEVDKALVVSVLSQHLGAARIIVFGSRANGNHKPYSDLDIAIDAAVPADFGWRELANLREDFEESDLNFRVDVVNYQNLNPTFKKIVDQTGQLFITTN